MKNTLPFVGTAGWSIPADCRPGFPQGDSVLERYAGRLNAVEINSSFYRPHRRSTYERWAVAVPDGFRFAVKAPKALTHETRLQDCGAPLGRFAAEVAGLGPKLAVVLVQLPPSLRFEAQAAEGFFPALRRAVSAEIACEPRHASWFDGDADRLLAALRVARVAADPAPAPGADAPGGWEGLVYRRLHGAPRRYWSAYPAEALAVLARSVRREAAAGAAAWCVFDNTASGAALRNALDLDARLG
jgi:uncharacterized protein YecE (DUF72 family)